MAVANGLGTPRFLSQCKKCDSLLTPAEKISVGECRHKKHPQYLSMSRWPRYFHFLHVRSIQVKASAMHLSATKSLLILGTLLPLTCTSLALRQDQLINPIHDYEAKILEERHNHASSSSLHKSSTTASSIHTNHLMTHSKPTMTSTIKKTPYATFTTKKTVSTKATTT